jgi:hypothetical protein
LFSNLFILFHPFSSFFILFHRFFLKKKKKGRKRQKKAGTGREISQLLGIVSLVVLLFESFCFNPFVSILLFQSFCLNPFVLRIQTKGFKQQTTKQQNKSIETKGFLSFFSNKKIESPYCCCLHTTNKRSTITICSNQNKPRSLIQGISHTTN